MPSLGADMDEGTVLEWHVSPGDAVHRGDIVAVVDTDKSEIDIEGFEDGVVEELLVGPGDRSPSARRSPHRAGAEAPRRERPPRLRSLTRRAAARRGISASIDRRARHLAIDLHGRRIGPARGDPRGRRRARRPGTTRPPTVRPPAPPPRGAEHSTAARPGRATRSPGS